jgi:hypothetical protein
VEYPEIKIGKTKFPSFALSAFCQFQEESVQYAAANIMRSLARYLPPSRSSILPYQVPIIQFLVQYAAGILTALPEIVLSVNNIQHFISMQTN